MMTADEMKAQIKDEESDVFIHAGALQESLGELLLADEAEVWIQIGEEMLPLLRASRVILTLGLIALLETAARMREGAH